MSVKVQYHEKCFSFHVNLETTFAMLKNELAISLKNDAGNFQLKYGQIFPHDEFKVSKYLRTELIIGYNNTDLMATLSDLSYILEIRINNNNVSFNDINPETTVADLKSKIAQRMNLTATSITIRCNTVIMEDQSKFRSYIQEKIFQVDNVRVKVIINIKEETFDLILPVNTTFKDLKQQISIKHNIANSKWFYREKELNDGEKTLYSMQMENNGVIFVIKILDIILKLQGRTFQMHVAENMKIKDLKLEICKKHKITIENLMYQSNVLDDDEATLHSIHMENNGVIEVVAQLDGGGQCPYQNYFQYDIHSI